MDRCWLSCGRPGRVDSWVEIRMRMTPVRMTPPPGHHEDLHQGEAGPTKGIHGAGSHGL